MFASQTGGEQLKFYSLVLCKEKEITMKKLGTYTKSDNLLSVTLHANALSKKGGYYGKVTRNTVTLENIIYEISDGSAGINPDMVLYVAVLIQKEILKALSQGKSVNLFDLGVLYVGMKGSVKGSKPLASELPAFKVKFTPSAKVNEALATLVADKIVEADTSPYIESVTNLWTGNDDGKLTKGEPVRIDGVRLKLGGDNYGVYFAELDGSNGKLKEEGTWTKVDDAKIFGNTRRRLDFFVPTTLDKSKTYRIVVRTSYTGGSGKSLKEPLVAESDDVTVADAS